MSGDLTRMRARARVDAISLDVETFIKVSLLPSSIGSSPFPPLPGWGGHGLRGTLSAPYTLAARYVGQSSPRLIVAQAAGRGLVARLSLSSRSSSRGVGVLSRGLDPFGRVPPVLFLFWCGVRQPLDLHQRLCLSISGRRRRGQDREKTRRCGRASTGRLAFCAGQD